MPDLDQLLDNLVADVTAGTRAPGAPSAIKQARRRRATVAVASAGAVALIAVGGALAAGTFGGSDQPSPIEEPPTPSPTAPQESAEPKSIAALTAELDAIVAQVPGWAITEGFPSGYDYAFNGRCSGGLDAWGKRAESGNDGAVGRAGIGELGFRSEAQAAGAVTNLIENLESCTSTAWQTQPIAQTGAVLASSVVGVAWIQQTGAGVHVLQVPTTDGPPPLGVQVGVVEWLASYRTWQDQNGSS